MFWERFSEECNRIKKKPNTVAEELGISSGAVTNWKNGAVPRGSTLQKLAAYFNVSADYLLGREASESETESDELTEYLTELKTRPEMRMLFSLAKGATKKDVEDAVKIIEALRSRGND